MSHLFLPVGILAVALVTVVYVVARNRSVLPVATGAVAVGLARVLAHVAKAVADRPRPCAVPVGWSRVYLGVHIPWTSRVEQALAWQWEG